VFNSVNLGVLFRKKKRKERIYSESFEGKHALYSARGKSEQPQIGILDLPEHPHPNMHGKEGRKTVKLWSFSRGVTGPERKVKP